MDERCDKQYSDFSRVSSLLLCVSLHLCVFVQILKDSVTVESSLPFLLSLKIFTYSFLTTLYHYLLCDLCAHMNQFVKFV